MFVRSLDWLCRLRRLRDPVTGETTGLARLPGGRRKPYDAVRALASSDGSARSVTVEGMEGSVEESWKSRNGHYKFDSLFGFRKAGDRTMTEDDQALSDDELDAVRELVRDFRRISKKPRTQLAQWTDISSQTLGDFVREPPKSTPDRDQAKLIVHQFQRNKIPIPEPLRAKLGSLLSDAEPRPSIPASTFISNVGIDDEIAKRSTQRFAGDFLHFSLNADDLIVTTKCHLLDKLGQDKAPVFLSFRYDPKGKRDLRSVGAYFFNFANSLYLIGSPEGSVNLRLSVFDVASEGPNKQGIIRGVVLGVRDLSILSSRCILVPMENVLREEWEYLYKTPIGRPDFDTRRDMFPEISRFLFGQESVSYIHLIGLATTPPAS